jgi:hypothetical protein
VWRNCEEGLSLQDRDGTENIRIEYWKALMEEAKSENNITTYGIFI